MKFITSKQIMEMKLNSCELTCEDFHTELREYIDLRKLNRPQNGPNFQF